VHSAGTPTDGGRLSWSSSLPLSRPLKIQLMSELPLVKNHGQAML